MYDGDDDGLPPVVHPWWLPLCDTPDRLGARLYLALRVRCHCCTFYRGVLLGMIVGALAAGLVAAFTR